MIGTALSYIRNRLEAHLREAQGLEADAGMADRVVFQEGVQLDPLALPPDRITMMVVNVQEDRECWDADRFQRRRANANGSGNGGGDGNGVSTERHYPDIHLELAVLFAANFEDYASAWDQLTEALIFFQQHPVIDRESDQNLPESIDRLTTELCSQSFQEQNELWSALRTSLRPALLYRFRLITLRGKVLQAQPLGIKTVQFKVNKVAPPAPAQADPASPDQGQAVKWKTQFAFKEEDVKRNDDGSYVRSPPTS